ncbi:MAG: class II fructose-bisphosphate aldolase [Propionibacteriaceae bacterium]|nr:class II fructose-bisphosphate aldolase [Propionibacteriaceae bacterium]
MSLAAPGSIVTSAARRGVGACAFNVIQLELAEAIVTGAEQAGKPVILQISENAVKYHGGLAPIALACQAIGRAANVDVTVHLDHAESEALVDEALALGIDSVMFDASKLDDAANRAQTALVAAKCHAAGAFVEAELGEVGGKDGVHAPGARTNPADAAQFVADTSVDALAVAVGSSHAMTERTASLDFELIAAIHAAVPVPLVLHGSSGVPDSDLAKAVRSGMTKINIATLLSKTFTDEVRAFLAANPQVADTRKYFKPARAKVAEAVAAIMGVLA